MLRRLLLVLRLGLAPLCMAGGAALAQQGGDLQARILYAFEAEDSNQLANLIQTLDTQVKAGSADEAQRYHLAHAEYRLGLLADDAHARAADAGTADAPYTACIDQLKAVLRRHADSVEALVLQSACYSTRARHTRIESALERARAARCLSAAARLAPRNPRVVYREAVEGLAHAAPGSPESQRAFQQLQLAAELFEASSSTDPKVPGWGHAEAYLELGRQLEARGDIVGARNWIEKSLIMAPDFKAAQRQLAALVRR
jgi:tetratricopeptide (TPR) repeat protein